MLVECAHCNASGPAKLPDDKDVTGLLACPDCGELVSELDVSSFARLIEAVVGKKRELQLSGRLGTRKQSQGMSDTDVDRDGLAAELAAAAAICPARLDEYLDLLAEGGPNRGRDLPPSLTGLDRPVEVKQTRYRDSSRGFLIVRPPRWTPGVWRSEYLEDSYYVLLCGQPFRFSMAGWIDRTELLRSGKLNPVPVRPRQRECWGIHWSKLRPMRLLADHFMATASK